MASGKQIAVNLGSNTLEVATFSVSGRGQLVMDQYASDELLSDPAADAARLDQAASAFGALSKQVRLAKEPIRYAVSGQSVFTRFVKLPPLDVDKLEQIVGFEAQQQVPFPLEEAVWEFQTLGQKEDIEVEVVLVAIKSDELDRFDDVIRSNGYETEGVDLAPMAVYNAFRYNYPDVDVPAVLIDFGERNTNLIYVEGSKFFVRSVNIGGRDITQAISREFAITFQEADERKLRDGFVALGGGYADHEDPEIAAMSKVIRNSLTRLHSEVLRTNNFYRTNQEGNPPQIAFLAGASSSLPYLNEFFQEKLRIPVEYFNALRNVKIGRKVDEGQLTSRAHTVGEIVGTGLRMLPDCPVELEFVPRVVRRERTLAKQAPFFWMAGLAIVAVLAATGFWLQQGAAFAVGNTDNLRNQVSDLETYARDIKEQEARLAAVRSRSGPYSDAVFDRVYWITTFKSLSQAMVNDMVWFVELQPLSKGQTLIDEPKGQEGIALSGRGMPTETASGDYTIDALQLKGLWRDNEDQGGSNVVYRYLDRLCQVSAGYLDIVEVGPDGSAVRNESGEVKKKFTDGELLNPINHGTARNRHAWEFTLRLPLPEGRKIPYTK